MDMKLNVRFHNGRVYNLKSPIYCNDLEKGEHVDRVAKGISKKELMSLNFECSFGEVVKYHITEDYAQSICLVTEQAMINDYPGLIVNMINFNECIESLRCGVEGDDFE